MLKKKRFVIGGAIVILAIVFLSYMGLQSSATYYYEVSEFLAQGNSIYDENVRVNGQVADGSVEQEAQGTILRFTVIDIEEEGSLPVFYQGVAPDTFKEGSEVVVEGHLDSDGIFQADIILAKCPSRYEPEE